ncbi:hypothetical protein OIU34_34810 [Pararhizobium sp. BT-229]|uniref:hypothetical protein n=1 Tax=Pararhizobium sp. BT-229 TaxID=2986923 RepID=UPI0021F6FF82|nr:hypothetical protein [Pararhizobium sp. BT-229]MCV9967006.1 hypothetical protein [Pararhizobium sp. BT-229]
MNWHLVTQKNGKTALIDLAKVMYIIAEADGCTVHFQLEAENSSGKRSPKAMTIKDNFEEIGKVLMGRKFLRAA